MIVGIADAAVNVSTLRPNWLAITDSRARPSTRLAIFPMAISAAAIAIRRASVAAGVAGDTGADVFMLLVRNQGAFWIFSFAQIPLVCARLNLQFAISLARWLFAT